MRVPGSSLPTVSSRLAHVGNHHETSQPHKPRGASFERLAPKGGRIDEMTTGSLIHGMTQTTTAPCKDRDLSHLQLSLSLIQTHTYTLIKTTTTKVEIHAKQ